MAAKITISPSGFTLICSISDAAGPINAYSDAALGSSLGTSFPIGPNAGVVYVAEDGSLTVSAKLNGLELGPFSVRAETGSAAGVSIDPRSDTARQALLAGTSSGTLALRPPAASFVGLYFVTDDNGGKLYRSDGTSWSATGPGVTEASAGADLGYKQITSAFATSSSSMVDVTGLTSLAVTFPSTGAIWLTVEGLLTNNAIGGRPFYQVIDDLSTIYMTAAPYEATVASMPLPCSDSRRRITATAGTVRTYKVQLSSVGGTGQSTFGPAVLRATVAA